MEDKDATIFADDNWMEYFGCNGYALLNGSSNTEVLNSSIISGTFARSWPRCDLIDSGFPFKWHLA